MHLNDLLAKSVSAPKNLRTKDGSDALVLALHCEPPVPAACALVAVPPVPFALIFKCDLLQA